MKPREPTAREREVLCRYASLDISLTRLRLGLWPRLRIVFRSGERRLVSHFALATPITIVEHVRRVFQRVETGEIKAGEVADWAAFLLMCDLYDFDRLSEEQIERLNELAVLPSARA